MKYFFSMLLLGMSFTLFVSCGGSDDAPEPAPTLGVPSITGLFQPEGEVDVTFTATGTFQTGNVFTAQLSDGSGSFASPTPIGTLNGTTAGTIEASLPASVANGSGYRIRVAASAPATLSPDNGSNLSIAAPTIAITNVTGALNRGGTITLSNTLTGTFAGCNSFTLQLSNAAGEFISPVSLGTNNGTTLNATQQAVLPITATAGAGYKLRWVSSCPVVTGTPSAAFEIKVQTLGVPTITGNLVVGGGVALQLPYSNGPWVSPNTTTIQLSDATGSFANPVVLTSLPTTLGTTGVQPFNGTIPTVPAGAGYRIRAVTTNPQTTGESSASFAIGPLPTLTLAPGTPTFTKLYSGFGPLFATVYTLRVSRTGTINAGTTFRLQRVNTTTGVITEVLLASSQANELISTGSTTVFVTLLNTGTTAFRFRMLVTGHAIVSNELQMNATQTELSTLGATIDAQAISFGNTKTVFFSNSPTTINNQEMLLLADAPTSVFGAATVRMFIGLPLVNENVPTGTVTGRLIVHYLNGAGGILAIYSSNASVTIAGTPTAYAVTASGPFTIPFVSGTVGNVNISVQSVSAAFRVQ